MTALSDRNIIRIDDLNLLELKVPKYISQTVKAEYMGGNTYKAEWLPAREALWIAPSLLESFRIRAEMTHEHGKALCMRSAALLCIMRMKGAMPWLDVGDWRQSLITPEGDIMHWIHTRHAHNTLDIPRNR